MFKSINSSRLDLDPQTTPMRAFDGECDGGIQGPIWGSITAIFTFGVELWITSFLLI